MAKRASLKKTATATPKARVGESLSIKKQEEIIQKANVKSVRAKRSSSQSVQRLTIDVPTEIYQKMKDLKHDQGITSKGLVVSLLRKHFSEMSV